MKIREAQTYSKEVVEFLFAELKKRESNPNKLAADIGLSRSSLYEIQGKAQNPGFYTLCIIADYLGYELKLLKKPDTPQPSVPEE